MADDRDEPSAGAQVANVVFALVAHVLLGLPLVALATGIASLAGETAAWLWGLSGVLLWALAAAKAVDRHRDLGATWGAVGRAWLWTLVGPIALVILALRLVTPRLEAEADAE